MREVAVVASSRTALAKAYSGSFNMTRPEDLVAHCIRDLLVKVPALETVQIEDIILGCLQTIGPPGLNIARRAALLAGLPMSVPGATVNRTCASGLQAIATAAYQILQGDADTALAGGVESNTLTPRDTDSDSPPVEQRRSLYTELGENAEAVAQRCRITREEQDEYALISQQRAARAQREGFFNAEIAPMQAIRADSDPLSGERTGTQEVRCDHDECLCPDLTLEDLLSLRPEFDSANGKGSVTSGNSAPLADGAAVALLMSRELADDMRIPYCLLFRGFVAVGCEQEEMGMAPVLAVPKLLRVHGLYIDDVDLWELNETFAAQVIFCRDQLAIPMDKLNVNGGAIALGHPYGMTGSRLVCTLANEMSGRHSAQYGVVATSAAGGQGAAALFERSQIS